MKGAVLENWKTIVIEDVASPDSGPSDVLINVGLTGICGSDVHIFNGVNPIARTPVIQGHEFMGRVAQTGSDVRDLPIGTRVAIQPLKFCGDCKACDRGTPHVCENLIVIGVNQNGGFAEQVVVPSECVFELSDKIEDEIAALAEPFSIATHSLKRGAITQSDRVLIIGAGPIGLYSALTARFMGAAQVCISEPIAKRRAVAESFGIDVIDPAQTNAIQSAKALSNGEGFDLIAETSGNPKGLAFAADAAAIRGRIVLLGFPSGGSMDAPITRAIIKELSLIGSRVCTRSEFSDTLNMLELLSEQGVINPSSMVASIRELKDLERSILDVENGTEIAKILIKPVASP